MQRCGPIDSLRQDVQHAVRLLIHEQSLTAAAVLSLMLVIGANTATIQLSAE